MLNDCIVAYQDNAGTKYGIPANQSVQAIIQDYFQYKLSYAAVAPFGTAYDTLEELQAVSGWSDAILMPAGFQPRQIKIGIRDFSLYTASFVSDTMDLSYAQNIIGILNDPTMTALVAPLIALSNNYKNSQLLAMNAYPLSIQGEVNQATSPALS